MGRWTESEARAWWSSKPWICGFNFLPSSSVNFLEMWHADTFDGATIERELGWASEIGFNAIRINLHYLVWRNDREGLLQRLDWVMGVADRLGMATVPCPFDDCGFGGFEPTYGLQPEPVVGVHNSRAVASPGRALLLDTSQWSGFEAYLRDLVGTFRTDPRVLFWDLYNEPGNRMIFEPGGCRTYQPDFSEASYRLMSASFGWTRDVAPEQPLTVGAWSTPPPETTEGPYQTEIDRGALALSDIVTFHAYWDTSHVRRFIEYLAQHNRPMLCTEWMARPVGSRIADQLELFRSQSVGCFQWGLVKGRTQTYLPWPDDLVAARGGDVDRSVWFHDILDETGRAYDPNEVAALRRLTATA